MDRELRQLIHQKGSKVKIVQSPPLASDGEDGDIYLYGLGSSGILYVKGFNKWWSFKSANLKGDGWHGSTSRVKILPTDFVAVKLDAYISTMAYTQHGYAIIYKTNSATGAIYTGYTNGACLASIAIPAGYTAKGAFIDVFNSDVDIDVSIYESRFSSIIATTLVDGEENIGEYIPFVSAISSDDTFITIQLDNLKQDDWIRGGYVDISPVLTPELIVEGATSEDGLFRG